MTPLRKGMMDTSNSLIGDREAHGRPKSYSNRIFVASFKADPELWSSFKEECALRGVSICHVLEALMEAWIQGQKATATVIKPVTVNLTMQHVVERPRRKARVEIKGGLDPSDLRKMLAACHRLVVGGDMPGYVGWCQYVRRWIRPGSCEGCPHQGDY